MTTIEITPTEEAVFNAASAGFSLSHAGNRLSELQIDHARWQAEKFADNADLSLSIMALGIVEEANYELVTAVESGSSDNSYDSIGDILIYTCAACTKLKLSFFEISRGFSPAFLECPEGDPLIALFKAIGSFCRVAGKSKDLTRGFDDFEKVRLYGAATLFRICKVLQWLMFNNDWEGTVLFEEVLTDVMKRNWRNNAITGQNEPEKISS